MVLWLGHSGEKENLELRTIEELIKDNEKLLQTNALLDGFGIDGKARNLIFQIDSTLKDGNQTWDDFLYYIRETDMLIKAEVARQSEEVKKINRHFRQECPYCKKTMYVQSVNTGLGDQTGDPTDKSVWICMNSLCRETIYNKKTVNEIFVINRQEGGV